MKINKINYYYDAQEYYDQMMVDIKIAAQSESHQDAVAQELIKQINPNVDTKDTLQSIKQKMDTFMAVGHQYKSDIEVGGSRYKEVLLIAMAELLVELMPYEIIITFLYPHITPLFTNLLVWYRDYLQQSKTSAVS